VKNGEILFFIHHTKMITYFIIFFYKQKSIIVLVIAIFLSITSSVLSQRPFYAGLRPSANKNRLEESQKVMDDSGLLNRFGGSNAAGSTTTKSNLPADALGDSYLISLLETYPIDQQPFWYINRNVIEARRNNHLTSANQLPVIQRSSFLSSIGFKNDKKF
jgi:hypothetical protein